MLLIVTTMRQSDEYRFHLENLREQDVDALVDILGISSQELMDMFPEKVAEFIKKEYFE